MSTNTNEAKPKKIITAEQRERMNAGRKRAMEERKLKKEAEKEQLKKEVKAMEKQKKKELDTELAALKQQKDSMETKKKTMEHRKEFRSRIRTKSQAQEEQQAEQPEPQAQEQQLEPDRNVTFDIEEAEKPDKEVIEDLLQRSPSPQSQAQQPPVETHHGLNEEKIFKSQVAALSHNAKPETKKFFKQVTDTYDNKLSITDNLRSMSEELKKLISSNVKQIKQNNEVIEAAEAKEDVIDKTLEEVKIEHKYKSQLASLMRLR